MHWSKKKCPDCVQLWAKFSIQNVVLNVYREENSKPFFCGAVFSCVFDNILLKCPNSTKAFLPWQISSCALVFWYLVGREGVTEWWVYCKFYERKEKGNGFRWLKSRTNYTSEKPKAIKIHFQNLNLEKFK